MKNNRIGNTVGIGVPVTILVCSVFQLCSHSLGGATADADNPYKAIAIRNLFDLKTPPPPPEPQKPPGPPAPKFTLTGYTTIFGKQMVLLSAPVPPKPGEQAKGPQSWTLGEDEREGDVHVKKINVNAEGELASVVIAYQGNELEPLTWDKNGAKGGGGGGVPGAPGNAGATSFNPAAPINPAPAAWGGGPSTANKVLPTRQLRVQPPAQPQPGGGGIVPGGGYGGTGLTVPGAGGSVALPSLGGGGFAGQPQGQNQAQPQTSLEEQEILMEANHQVAVKNGDPTAVYYPPSRGNPNRNAIDTPQAPPLPIRH